MTKGRLPKHIPALKKEQAKSYSTHWKQSLFLGGCNTQKSYMLGQSKIYVVHVHPDATKLAIKAAFAELFDVMPLSVNTVTLPGKRKTKKIRAGGGHKEVKTFSGKMKKAMIRLPADAKFDFAQA